MERGVGLGLAEEERDPPCSPLPCLSLTPSGRCPVVLTHMSMCCLVVARGLAGGCHIAQIQTVPGVSRRHWDCPWEHFVSSWGGTAQLLSGTCLGKRRLCLL